MDAVEFETIAKGQNIKIPDRYKDFAEKQLKVILIKTRDTKQKKALKRIGLSELALIPISVEKIHVFSKEELNER